MSISMNELGLYVLEVHDTDGVPVFYAEGLDAFDVFDITGYWPEEIQA